MDILKVDEAAPSNMVPPVGIEPTILAERDFESRASTNSATGASAGFPHAEAIRGFGSSKRLPLSGECIGFVVERAGL